MVDHSLGWFSTMKVLTVALLLVTLQYSLALSPTSCDASEPSAEKVLDLINKGRKNGFAFQLLRVSDAHLDTVVRMANEALSWEVMCEGEKGLESLSRLLCRINDFHWAFLFSS